MKSLLSKALRLLAKRDYSEQEMRRKLATHSSFLKYVNNQDDLSNDVAISDENIDQVINYCQQHDWLNDNNYAALFIVNYSNKGYGPRRIQYELRKKGINQSIIDFGMQNCNIDWYKKAQQLLLTRFGCQRSISWKEKAKAQRYLINRGFMQDEIHTALSRFK